MSEDLTDAKLDYLKHLVQHSTDIEALRELSMKMIDWLQEDRSLHKSQEGIITELQKEIERILCLLKKAREYIKNE